jgi:DNA-binding MarR family transcriptional regulator
VTLPQFRLLAVLADLGPVPSGRAARTLGLDPSTVTRLAGRMVAAGHVARGADPRHRSVVTLALTPADQEAVTVALGLLVEAAGDEYGVTPHRPVPL